MAMQSYLRFGMPVVLGLAGVLCLAGASAAAESAEHHHGHDHSDVSLPAEVTCESYDQQQTSCDMDTAGDVRVERQLSHTRCVEGQTWGLSKHSVWVSGGCRATFRNVSRGVMRAASSGGVLLGACNTRKGDSGALVTEVPVGEANKELIIDYPDGRYLCMVSVEGQVLSVTPLRKR